MRCPFSERARGGSRTERPPGACIAVDHGFASRLVVANHLIIELAFYTALAFGMSRPAVSQGYLRAKVYFDRTASVVLGFWGCGCCLRVKARPPTGATGAWRR
ncbi:MULTISPECIES: hypothetical protein [Sulfitobacter]|uniref:hypothetical protein n=1 Tax=Sulfitobacter TaxID=60136 RepID=UPI0023078200|nr:MULTISPECIES: hypothetical protein [Sulfitobacter]MDF3401463.1 hypothetical protein [Sulfitobacter sp. KE39]MDF3404869.1 hypothetical protein [Sulfitobacter sp. Ks35]MDF3411983.1 hypothetical protein [Sulfitobacter sp. KE38]WCE68364.1 hypothetical protein PL335_16190 [Sulfitobacter faviae]